jgi:hypothetical protein
MANVILISPARRRQLRTRILTDSHVIAIPSWADSAYQVVGACRALVIAWLRAVHAIQRCHITSLSSPRRLPIFSLACLLYHSTIPVYVQ